MFTKEDLDIIDREYFVVLHEGAVHTILKSRMTGHIWDIENRVLNSEIWSIVVHHKHKKEHPYHVQRNYHPSNMDEAQILIEEHDKWVVENRSKKSR